MKITTNPTTAQECMQALINELRAAQTAAANSTGTTQDRLQDFVNDLGEGYTVLCQEGFLDIDKLSGIAAIIEDARAVASFAVVYDAVHGEDTKMVSMGEAHGYGLVGTYMADDTHQPCAKCGRICDCEKTLVDGVCKECAAVKRWIPCCEMCGSRENLTERDGFEDTFYICAQCAK